MENLQIITEVSFTKESRAFCPECDFLKSRCLCSTLKVLNNQTHLIILQHPSEQKHPLNTVRIMKKSFQKISLLVGEDFSSDLKLNTVLADSSKYCALLYPEADATILNSCAPVPHITDLIIIDGTWRKAKKIYGLSQNLKHLPKLRLIPEQQTDYRIRKSTNENALSTLEAAASALMILEPRLETQSLLNSFHFMIDYQIKKMGREIYQNNYLDKKKE